MNRATKAVVNFFMIRFLVESHEYSEPAIILKALCTKEGLSQVEFAEVIDVAQKNLSAMDLIVLVGPQGLEPWTNGL